MSKVTQDNNMPRTCLKCYMTVVRNLKNVHWKMMINTYRKRQSYFIDRSKQLRIRKL